MGWGYYCCYVIFFGEVVVVYWLYGLIDCVVGCFGCSVFGYVGCFGCIEVVIMVVECGGFLGY